MISPEKLPYAARRVLNCVNQMFAAFFWKTAICPQLPKLPSLVKPFIALENATVESSLLAIRAFDDFLRDTRQRKDDLVASDFPGFASSSVGIDPAERVNINKKIVHLTHLDLEAATQAYSYRDALGHLLPGAIALCEHVLASLPDDAQLHELAKGTKTVCERVKSQYVDR